MTRQDRACSIALEHVRWAQADGQSPRAILKALKARASVHSSWDDVYAALVIAWMNLDTQKIREAA